MTDTELGVRRQKQLVDLESDRYEFKYQGSLAPNLRVALGKSLALPDPHVLHLNETVRCEAWESVSVRPWHSVPAHCCFTYEELWPRDVKQLAQDHTAGKGQTRTGTLLVWV